MKTPLLLFALICCAFMVLESPAKKPEPPCPNCPKVIGRVTLAEGMETVYHPDIRSDSVVIFNPTDDGLSPNSRVIIYQIEPGFVTFWAVNENYNLNTTDEPMVHYVIY